MSRWAEFGATGLTRGARLGSPGAVTQLTDKAHEYQ